MRVNVAFGILLGFTMFEMLLLQAAVLVDGYAHAITKHAVLPSMGDDPDRVCDVNAQLTCIPAHYCIADDAGYIQCCSDGEACRPPTTCVPSKERAITPCEVESGCLVCNKSPSVECMTQYNDEFTITSIKCDISAMDLVMAVDGPLAPNIARWRPATVTASSLSAEPSETSAPSNPASTTPDSTESEALSTTPLYTWTMVRTATGDPSSGGSVSLITITVTGQPTRSASSTTNSTLNPSTAADNGSSGSGTGKKVGATIGVISICVLAAAGAWFAYRRRLNRRRNNQNVPWQAPSAGPHYHHPDAVELDGVGAERAEMDHSPASRPELDPSPRPSELENRELSELPSPPVSPLPVGDGGSPAINRSRSPVSPLGGRGPVSETAPARDPPAATDVSGRYGPGGFLNPEYALRDGLFSAEDDRQVAKSTLF